MDQKDVDDKVIITTGNKSLVPTFENDPFETKKDSIVKEYEEILEKYH